MSKYNAKKTTYKDIIFDSIAEADFYKMLLSEEAKGNVGEIVLQPSFRLQDGYNHNGKKVKPINYKADFMFKDIVNDKLIVIDVKGMATEVANLKRKMFNMAVLLIFSVIVISTYYTANFSKAKDIVESENNICTTA